MAAGVFTVLNIALEKLADGTFDLDTNSFCVVLATKTQALSAAFAGASTNAVYADLTAEVVGTGYTAGGETMTGVAWSRSTGTVTFSADPSTWETLTATMKYAVVCKEVAGAPTDILGIVDLETTNADGRISAGGDFIINWTGGLFTLSRA